MKTVIRALLWLLLLNISTLLLATTALAHPHIIKVDDGIEVSPEELIDDLDDAQVIFIGEFHDHRGHHRAQLSIMNALKDDNEPLAIGLEMFRKDSQDALDGWTSGELPFRDFISVYLDNWSMWAEYRDIFHFAQDEKVPMVGLNISRELTSKVARTGFDSLNDEQRQLLGNVQCVVDPTYGRYIRQAMGGHGGHGQQYLFFCEAQLLWDTMMARRVVDYLKENPDYRMVVLAGSGHSWKFGIPRQMLEQADLSYRVVLPEVVGRLDRRNVTTEFTDYLWLDEGTDGWEF